ncbi:PD-(D/E)XK nuclease family protein [Planobacterium oryzisoli]|uniref:PD-(D/E)XK nuclease family protein n=1 Tax=Planobacterium oryzisoli TaxID=2771435 RepID=A0A930YW88_9FLAO|nr:PD-(D/E)XK nuclease family protein [Planobacterium oryzisoli]MBF5027572.1 PD-(D/E)XK nuclease family protein [Planobacterium oryzisoli]
MKVAEKSSLHFIKYEKMLLNFRKINKIEVNAPTYMEIAGYPHFENVSSNILSFFLNTNQKHKLNDLVLKSLLQCIEGFDETAYRLKTNNIYREYGISNLKRIDILVECPEMCVSIENKIFHWLHNDLEIYEADINRKFFGNKTFHVVLSLKKENVIGSFVSITYEEFFEKVKSNLGQYILKGESNYLAFLLDYMKTIENHFKMEEINKEMFAFLMDNSETITELQNEKVKLENSLYRTVNQLSQRINFEDPLVKVWRYERYVIVYDFLIEDSKIAVDINVDYDKLTVDIFERGRSSNNEVLSKTQLIKNYSFARNHRGYVLLNESKNFFDLNLDEVAETIHNYLTQIKIS